MKTNTITTVLALALLANGSLTLRAQVPETISYQGRITANGTNFSGSGQFKFALVDPGQPVATQKAGASRTINGLTGKITAVVVTDGGLGYLTPPIVRAIDPVHGGGSGASLTAVISGGQVTAVTIINGGFNYSISTYIDIAAPPAHAI